MTINPREIYSFFASKGFLERLQVPESEIKRRPTTPRREEPPPRKKKKKKAKKRSRERSLEDEPRTVPAMSLLQILIMCASLPASLVFLVIWIMAGTEGYPLGAIVSGGLFVGLLLKRTVYHG